MTRLASIIAIAFITACSSETNEETYNLEGDWIISEESDQRCLTNEISGLRFDSTEVISLNNNIFYYGGNYVVKNDSILTDIFGKNEIFTIVRLNKDSLVLLSQNGCETSLYNRNLEFDSDLNFSKIYFRGIACFGTCPNFEMTLHSTGMVHYQGNRNVKFKGDTSFSIAPNQIKKIDSLFKFSKINDLDTNGAYAMIDDWMIETEFDYNDTAVSLNGTFSAMPFRIKPILFFMLKELEERELK